LTTHTTVTIGILAQCSLFFVVTALQSWVTVYLTDECTPITAELSLVVTTFGICAITGPIAGVISGGLALDSVGGQIENPNGSAMVAVCFSLIAFLASFASLVMTDFWPFIVCLWIMLAGGAANVACITGLVLGGMVEEELRKLVAAYAIVHQNIWGFTLGPLLVGVVASATQQTEECKYEVASACMDIGCNYESVKTLEDGCSGTSGLTWGFRVGMGWAGPAFITTVMTWWAIHKMLVEREKDRKTFWKDKNGVLWCIEYIVSGAWAWRMRAQCSQDGTLDKETAEEPIPCCWLKFQVGAQLPSGAISHRTLVVESMLLELLSFNGNLQLEDSNLLQSDDAIGCDPETSEDTRLGVYVDWKLQRIVTKEGEVYFPTCVSEVREFVNSRTDNVLIVLQDGALWEAYLEPYYGYWHSPRCRDAEERIDLLHPSQGPADNSPYGEKDALRVEAKLLAILRSYEKKKLTVEMLESFDTGVPAEKLERYTLVLVMTKGIDDPRGRQLRVLYEKSFKDKDFGNMKKYFDLLQRHHNSGAKRRIFVLNGDDEKNPTFESCTFQNFLQVDPASPVKQILYDLAFDDDVLDGQASAEPISETKKPVLWAGKKRLNPETIVSDCGLLDGAVLVLRDASWNHRHRSDDEDDAAKTFTMNAQVRATVSDLDVMRMQEVAGEEVGVQRRGNQAMVKVENPHPVECFTCTCSGEDKRES